MSVSSIGPAIEALQATLGPKRVSVSRAERDQYARDQSSHPGHRPDVVVWPETTAEVSAVLRHATEARLPVTPWGAGTSLEGNPIPVRGGILLDLRRMDQILAVHAQDFQATVQPGVLYKDMNESLARHGLFFAPDPGANASIGGMIANNAAGVRTVKYGATRDNVLALEVALVDGTVIRTGSRSVKQSAGYDLTHLFVGSEGTLGVITEATLKLVPRPEHFSAVIAPFPSLETAAQVVFEIIETGLEPAALELLGRSTAAIINRDGQLALEEAPTLLMEFNGVSPQALQETLRVVRTICRRHDCLGYQDGLGRAARNRIWRVRHELFEIQQRQHPGQTYLVSDVAVPISQFPPLISYLNQTMREMSLEAAVVGHAGDGNLHTTCFFPPDDAAARARVEALYHRLVTKALALGGTASGEHGIGLGKRKYMTLEHGTAAIDLMRRLKTAFDPYGILNPGKVLP